MAPYMNCFTFLQTISLVYLFVTVTCSTGSSLSHDEECSALFQFKQSMIQQDDAACAASWFQTFHSWKPTGNTSNSGFDCCLWYGVECKYGHVIGLDLSECSLCGHINTTSTLFSLVHLWSLNLAWNNFDESQIPSEIGCLKQLRSLNLSYSNFIGQIPSEISQLKQLSLLDLSWNLLKLHSPNLQNLVQNLIGLQELHLSWVHISSSVPHLLANFSSLRSLRLTHCSLRNEFPATIFQLPNLKYLALNSNTNLTGSIPEFCNNSLLEHLNLAHTGFSGHIPGSLSNLTQLTYLDLSSNNFTGFVPSLVSLSKLNVLGLDGNRLENGRFPSWIGKLTQLNELSLSSMNIDGEIPLFLANLTRLSYVDMGYNSLRGHIPSFIFNLTKLTHLDLVENQLEGPISSSFSNFQNLQYVNLLHNSFSGRVDLDTFLGLNKLQTLKLGYSGKISLVVTNNYTNTTLPELKKLQLSSCNLKEFPSLLRFQNKLKRLHLDHNEIHGLVPVWIWNNSQETLEMINLSNNFITGFHQHPHFLPWRRIEGILISANRLRGQLPIPPKTTAFYDISYNYLTGELPTLICEVKSLQYLDLSYNKMSGTLPSCLGSLKRLNLRRNSFHGILNDALMQENALENIDLSENRFTGQLPRSLGNCTNLEVLILADNSFHDIFPSWLGTLANLQVLVLGSNNFYGPIQGPTAVRSQFPKMRIIDLSNNSFSGELHEKHFQTWNAMKVVGELSIMNSITQSKTTKFTKPYRMTLTHKGVKTEYDKILTIFTAIDLSCNHFEGEIPLSLKDLQGLQSLNLSNNRFTGPVFQSFGYLKDLESLDLSQNKLSGEIPQDLVQLNFLSIFNVSFNHLDGRIPQGQQFNTFENASYQGNPGLCGKPLSNECGGSKASTFPPESNESESLLPSERIDWIIIFCGVGSGLVVGFVIGNFLYERYSDRFTMRKNRWVRPLRNTRRNQGGIITSSSKGKEKV